MGAVLLLGISAWGYWWLHHEIRSADVAPAGGEVRRGNMMGLEDTTAWRPTRGPWTALDEHQLTRLLTDSAPPWRAATGTADPGTADPVADREDIS